MDGFPTEFGGGVELMPSVPSLWDKREQSPDLMMSSVFTHLWIHSFLSPKPLENTTILPSMDIKWKVGEKATPKPTFPLYFSTFFWVICSVLALHTATLPLCSFALVLSLSCPRGVQLCVDVMKLLLNHSWLAKQLPLPFANFVQPLKSYRTCAGPHSNLNDVLSYTK